MPFATPTARSRSRALTRLALAPLAPMLLVAATPAFDGSADRPVAMTRAHRVAPSPLDGGESGLEASRFAVPRERACFGALADVAERLEAAVDREGAKGEGADVPDDLAEECDALVAACGRGAALRVLEIRADARWEASCRTNGAAGWSGCVRLLRELRLEAGGPPRLAAPHLDCLRRPAPGTSADASE